MGPRRQRRRRRRRRTRRQAAEAALWPPRPVSQTPPWFPRRPMSQRTLALWSWGAQGAQLYQFECILFCLIGSYESPNGHHTVMYIMIHPFSGRVILTLCHLLSYFLL